MTVETGDGIALTVISVNTDAADAVLNENMFNDPPDAGNRFVMARIRAQNVGGNANSEKSVGESEFKLVGSSAVKFSPLGDSCGVIPDELDADLFLGGLAEGNVCFQIPQSEADLVLFHDPMFSFNKADRRWLTLANPDSVDGVRPAGASLEASPDQTPGYFRTNPVPHGTSVETDGGLSLTVVSVNPDAADVVLNENMFNEPPSEGSRFVMVRVRAENAGGNADGEKSVDESDFSLAGSSAVRFSPFERSCGVIPDELDADLFRGGSVEGNVCFHIPQSETDLILFYDPMLSFNKFDRRWMRLPNQP